MGRKEEGESYSEPEDVLLSCFGFDVGFVEERKWLTAPSAEEEPPALLPVLGVLRKVLPVFGVLRKVLCGEVVSAWLMWAKEELLRRSGSREA